MRVRAVNHVHKYNWEVALANQVEQKAQRHHEGGVVEEEERGEKDGAANEDKVFGICICQKDENVETFRNLKVK